ncbi:MAG: flippase-like domain-containing protein [Candidatus Verstraetearchaeota archaeon]|nr:flippase-like domain-containing protein [Candidatus Verstraetearchaeota archaeon]
MKKLPISLTSVMLIVGGIIFIGYLYLVGFWNVVEVIRALDLRIALSTILIDLVCIGLFAFGWKLLLRNPGMKFKHCFEIVLVSIFGDLMIPTGSISGEIFRVTLTTKRSSLQISEATASVLLHRLLLGITFGGVLGVSLVLIIMTQAIPLAGLYLFVALAVIDLILGVIGIYAAFRAQRFEKFVERLAIKTGNFIRIFRSRYNVEDMRARVMGGFNAFGRAIAGVKKTSILASAIVLTARWFLIASIPYLMFISLGYPVSYWVALSVSIFASMVQMIPIGIPGLVGVMEISMTAFFMVFGIPADIAASGTILTRLVIFWFELLISGAAASFQGIRGLQGINNKGKTMGV